MVNKDLIQNVTSLYKSFVRSSVWRYGEEPGFDVNKYKAAAFDSLVEVLDKIVNNEEFKDFDCHI